MELLLNATGASAAAQRDDTGQTGLHLAASAGHVPVVAAMLDAAAASGSLHAVEERGLTALDLAAGKGHLDVLVALMAAGASSPAALHHAAFFGCSPVAELLLARARAAGPRGLLAALLGRRSLVDGGVAATPLHLAAMSGHRAVVELLLLAVETRDAAEAREGLHEVRRALHDAADSSSKRPSELARWRGHLDLAAFLEAAARLPSTAQLPQELAARERAHALAVARGARPP